MAFHHKIWQLFFVIVRLQERITEMTLDKEYDVAVHGVRLVTFILKYVSHPALNNYHLRMSRLNGFDLIVLHF